MIWIDIVILAIIMLSTLIGMFRGFVSEALSLATWILAVWIGIAYAAMLSHSILPEVITEPNLRVGIAFAILFVSTLIVGGVINLLASMLVKKTGLSGTNMSIGLVFGLGRGVLIIAAAILLAGLTTLPEQAFWQESIILPKMEPVALWLRDLLPEDLAGHFRLEGISSQGMRSPNP